MKYYQDFKETMTIMPLFLLNVKYMPNKQINLRDIFS